MPGHDSPFELRNAGLSPSDPGNGGRLVADRNPCAYELVTTGAETRTLPNPDKSGLFLVLTMKTDGGDCVVTATTAVNQTGNTSLTFNDAGDTLVLVSVPNGSAFRWRVVSNDGVSLSS